MFNRWPVRSKRSIGWIIVSLISFGLGFSLHPVFWALAVSSLVAVILLALWPKQIPVTHFSRTGNQVVLVRPTTIQPHILGKKGK